VKPRLTILLALIVAAPLAIVGWLGARVARNERDLVEHRLRELSLGQLRAVDLALATAVDRYRALVAAEMEGVGVDRDDLRRLTWRSPYVVHYYLLDRDGDLMVPPVATPAELTSDEREALQRTRALWESGSLMAAASGGEARRSGEAETGWYAGYWGGGLQWMLWRRQADRILVAEINRARFLAELVGALPETDTLAPELAQGRVALRDATGGLIYQWGSFEAGDGSLVASLAPRSPLRAWSLEYHAPAAAFGSAVAGGFLISLLAGLALLGASVIGLATYLHREQSRESREAARRVSFVNQVSHELKTPLTSIRMYAELLEQGLDEQDEPSRRRLAVIVSESQRLSRLIANVLTFGRSQRGALQLHPRPGVVDEALRGVLERLRPALEAQEIDVVFEPGAGQPVWFDSDLLEQIVGNLVSNVEKYAAAGKRLEVESRQSGAQVEVTVADWGPGVSPRDETRVFEPFYRVSNALTDGVSGTGIGLTISRELARLHGGDLVLEPGERGARFRLTLDCPLAEPEGRRDEGSDR
jgi:signal transduction histidine kinase